MAIKLNDTQRAIITTAAVRNDQNVMPLPTTLRAPAAAVAKTINVLIANGLLAEVSAAPDQAAWRHDEISGDIALIVTASGLTAIGVEIHEVKRSTKGAPRAKRRPAAPATVVGKTTKQDVVLALLRGPLGASIAEICEATGWQRHSTRGFMSGALKKRLGIEVISEKDGAGARRYFVAPIKQAV